MYTELSLLGGRIAIALLAIVLFVFVDRETGWFVLALYAIAEYQFQMRMQKPK